MIEGMQQTFVMVLTSAMKKIRKCLESRLSSQILSARMEICLEELLRTFKVEIETLEAFFKPVQTARSPTRVASPDCGAAVYLSNYGRQRFGSSSPTMSLDTSQVASGSTDRYASLPVHNRVPVGLLGAGLQAVHSTIY